MDDPPEAATGHHCLALGGAVDALRVLALSGELTHAESALPGCCYGFLRTAAFEIAAPLVWRHHTRPLEFRKGHPGCASSLRRMRPECADGFTDDLQAVVEALLNYRPTIGNIEGWIVRRMRNAITDGHRARRAREMHAQQRVRVPAWLASQLHNDPWLVLLARRILEWVGVQFAAGGGLWPLDSWSFERAWTLGDWRESDDLTALQRDIDVVLSAMRHGDERWYLRYVEDPLGRKWAPVQRTGSDDDTRATRPLIPVAAEDGYERALEVLADLALRRIEDGLAAGMDPAVVVPKVLAEVFHGTTMTALSLADVPNSDRPWDGALTAELEPERLEGIITEVLGILAPASVPGPAPERVPGRDPATPDPGAKRSAGRRAAPGARRSAPAAAAAM